MRRLISFVLALTMLLGCFSVTAFAAEDTNRVASVNKAYFQAWYDNGTSSYVTTRSYNHKTAANSGAALMDYFQFGETTYFTFINAAGKTNITDAKYINAEGIECNWTTGGEYVESVTIEKMKYDANGNEKYFLAVKMKTEAAAGVNTDQRLVGTVTLTHDDAATGYTGTDGKIVVEFDDDIRSASRRPFRFAHYLLNKQISSTATGAAPVLGSAMNVMIETAPGQVNFGGYDGSTTATARLQRGTEVFFPIVDTAARPVSDDKYFAGVADLKFTSYGGTGTVEASDVELSFRKMKNENGADQQYLVLKVKENANVTGETTLYGYISFRLPHATWSKLETIGGYPGSSRVEIKKFVDPAPEGGSGEGPAPGGAVEADRVTAVNLAYFQTTNMSGNVTTVGYDHRTGANSGDRLVKYFQFGEKTFFTLLDGVDSTVNDERYVNPEGLSVNWTSGGEYVKDVKLEKAKDVNGKEKYFLTVELNNVDWSASLKDARLTGTVTLTHNDPDFGYKATDGKLVANFDHEIWHLNDKPYRLGRTYGGVTISGGTDGTAHGVVSNSTMPVLLKGPDGKVGLFNYDGTEGQALYLKPGVEAYLPLVDRNGNPITEEKYIKGWSGLNFWPISPNTVDKSNAITSTTIRKEINTEGLEQYYFVIKLPETMNVNAGEELYGYWVFSSPHFQFSDTNSEGGPKITFRKKVLASDEDVARVVGVNVDPIQVLVPEGHVTTREWNLIYPTPAAKYIKAGETVYFTFKNTENTIVSDPKFVENTTIDISGLTSGADLIKDIRVVSMPYNTRGDEKHYVAITVGNGSGVLKGNIVLTNNTPGVGFNTTDGKVTMTFNNITVGDPQQSKVKTINSTIQCMFQNQVYYWNESGEGSINIKSLPYGNTAYFQLLNEQSGDVVDYEYVKDIEITHTFDPALVSDVSIVAERYIDLVSDTRYYVAVTFIDEPENAEEVVAKGKITLKKGDGTGEYDIVGGSITSAELSVTLQPYVPYIGKAPTEGDSRRVHHFMRLGTNNQKIWALLENEDGRPDRYENAYGAGAIGSGDTIVDYGGAIYYMLADCEDRPVTDPDYVENIKITPEIDNYGTLINDIRIVKARLADGISVNGKPSKDLYCYFLKISIVPERYNAIRTTITGDIILKKKGDEGIATKDNELKLAIEFIVGRQAASVEETLYNREYFGDRVLADEPTRYMFKDPSFAEGGDWYNVGTDKQDVIYYTDDEDAYITVNTTNQGRMLLYVDTLGEEHLWDIYGIDNELKFIMGHGDKFTHLGVITIEQPAEGWCLYRIKGGMLYEADDAVFDEKTKEWKIRSRELGQWCLSDKPLDLDLQYNTVLDPYKFVPLGTSINKPTGMLDDYILNQTRLGDPEGAIEHYVLSKFTVKAAVSDWIRENLKDTLNLNSKFGWTVSIDPKDISKEGSGDFTLAPFVTDTPNSVLVELFENSDDSAPEYPVTVTITRKKLQDLKSVAVYGETENGKLVHVCDANTADGTVSFETVDGIDSYILTNYRRDAVSLKQYNSGKNA